MTAPAATRLFLLGVAIVSLAGCATPGLDAVRADAAGLPTRAEIADVPFYPQEEFFCGPAALAMALSWSGLPADQQQVAEQVYTPEREGSLQTDMLTAARRNGRLAVRIDSLQALLLEIASGHPVLVFQNLGLGWVPRWHYAVAIGYDLDREVLVLRSGLEPALRTDLGLFDRTWARGENWALVVLPPDRLPATAKEPAVLEAAVGLERAGRAVEAAKAYGAMIRRFPESLGARLGLGNALFAVADYSGAEHAYRVGTERHPDSADLWNNLAYALARQGHQQQAIAAARRAVEIGGERIEAYRDTLREILAEAK